MKAFYNNQLACFLSPYSHTYFLSSTSPLTIPNFQSNFLKSPRLLLTTLYRLLSFSSPSPFLTSLSPSLILHFSSLYRRHFALLCVLQWFGFLSDGGVCISRRFRLLPVKKDSSQNVYIYTSQFQTHGPVQVSWTQSILSLQSSSSGVSKFSFPLAAPSFLHKC